MTTVDLLDLLRQKDVKIWAEGSHVRVNAPKGILTPELELRIRESKEELVKLLRVTSQSGGHAEPSIGRVVRQDPLPLTFAQERLWFFDQLQPGNPAYNISSAFSLSGDLQIRLLEQSLRELVQRHEVLRTTFPLVAGSPIQKVSSDLDAVVHLEDLRHLPKQEQEEATRQLLEREAQTSFRLGEGPLWKFTLIREGEHRWVLIFVIHHIVADAWSLDIFFREFVGLYNANLGRHPLALSPLPFQYGDFALWQRQAIHQKRLEPQLEYWRNQLSGCPMFLDLPTDRTRPSIQNFEGGKVSFNLSQKNAVDLAELGSREGATIFMVLLAAFQTLLFRYSEQEEFLVGVPIAGRTIQEVAGVMGLFVNTLALRVNFSGLPSYDDILTQTRRVVVEAFGNQDIPFEQVVTALQPERTLSHSPLFQVMFAYHNFSLGQGPVVEGISGLTVAPINLAQQTAKFDLTMFVEETVNGLNGAIEYRKDLFEEETIQRMARHFEVLLKGIVESPQKPVMSLPLLSQEERHQVLVEWNNTQHEYPNCCLQELIEAQVIQTPNDTAVIFEDFQMTYDELNQRANRVAHYLRKAGVGPDALVGIFLNRSIDMMVVLLGVLKAGGAYVPIDLSSPTERIRKIITESEMLVLFTENSLSGKIPSPNSYPSQDGSQEAHSEFIAVEYEKTEKGAWPRVVCLDGMDHELEQEPNTNPSSLATPDNLAYVIYTSGTTGNPKGVMIPHRGLVNYLFWCSRAYHLKGGIGSLVHSSIGFDMAVTSLFAPLLVGNSVTFLPESTEVDTLPQVLTSQRGWSFLKVTPGHMDMLAYRMPGRDGCVKRFIVGGEALRGRTINVWRIQDPEVIVVNEYGPTEASVGCCVYEVPIKEMQSDLLPIGRPISNVQLYILNRCQEPVPIGVPGELYIGGHGLARGYFNQPDLTDQMFVPNPFKEDATARLYKTGDRCRYRADGNIEFLGRVDRQVKLRGFRIELAEVEGVLSTHPAVQESVVVLNEQLEHPAIIAYMVLSPSAEQKRNKIAQESGGIPSTLVTDLQAFLQQWLPMYMIPSNFLSIARVPLSLNGKTDYRALPKLNAESYGTHHSIVAPSDSLEAQLVCLWEGALGVKPISVHDNFFELGGHSLLAVRLWARMESLLGQSLPLSLLYRSPTIAQLALAIREQGKAPHWEFVVEVQPGGGQTPMFVVPGAGDTGLYLRYLGKYLGSNQPLYGFQAQGLDGKKDFHSSVEEMAKAYLHEMRRIQPEGPYLLGGYSFGGVVAYEMAQQLQEIGQTVAVLMLFDTPGPNYRRRATSERIKEPFKKWFGRHLENVGRLSSSSKGHYVWSRIKEMMRSWWSRTVPRARRWMCYTWRVLRLPIPLSMRSHYMLYVTSEEAKAGYKVRPYAGPLTIFQCDETFSSQEGLGWSEVAWGGLEVKTVLGKHEHLLQEPNVQVLAEFLRNTIETVPRSLRKE